MLSVVSKKIFTSSITAEEKDLITSLYNKGCNHLEITQSLYRARLSKKVTTTPERCQRDVEEWLLASHRKKVG